MKAILEFNLPDEQDEYDLTVKASKFYCALWDIKNNIRQIWKYEELSDEVYEMVDKIYGMVCEESAVLDD